MFDGRSVVQLRENIIADKCKLGQELPSERMLEQEYDVNGYDGLEFNASVFVFSVAHLENEINVVGQDKANVLFAGGNVETRFFPMVFHVLYTILMI